MIFDNFAASSRMTCANLCGVLLTALSAAVFLLWGREREDA